LQLVSSHVEGFEHVTSSSAACIWPTEEVASSKMTMTLTSATYHQKAVCPNFGCCIVKWSFYVELSYIYYLLKHIFD
jgi:hypothetical protein